MAQTLDELVTFFEADLTGLEAGVRRGGRAVDAFVRDTADSLKRGGAAMRRAGVRMSAAITLPIIAGGAALVKLASDAEETRNKFNVVFSQVGDAARQASQDLQDGFIMSQLESEKLLASTGDLLVGFGVAQDESLALSLAVQKLAADLASFQNLEGGAERASLALTKALLGERESAKELGIVINEELVKKELQEQAAKGLTFATEQQAKAQATLTIALRQTIPAQGDVARSSESFANQVKALRKDLTNLGVTMGQTLLPIAQKLVAGFRSITAFLSKLRPEVRESIVMWALVAAAIGPVLIVVGTLVGALGTMIGLVVTVGGGIITLTGAFVAALPVIVAVAAALAAVFFGFKDLVSVKGVLQSLGGVFNRFFEGVVKGFRELTSFIRGDIDTLTTNMGKTIIFLSQAARGLLVVWEVVASGIRVWILVLLNAFKKLGEGLEEIASFLGLESLSAQAQKNIIPIAGAIDELNEKMEASKNRINELLDASGKAPIGLREAALPVFEFFDKLPEVIDNAKRSISDFLFAVPDVAIPGVTTPGIIPGMEIPTDLQEIDFSDLIAKLQQIRQVVETVTGSMADNFASAFTSILMGTQSFGKGMVAAIQGFVGQMISLLVKFLIERVFMAKVQAVANAIAAAPHPFLIATFVAVALGAFASAMSSVGGSQFDQGPGGGGGEVGAIAAAPAIGPQSDVIRSIDEGVDAEGGSPNRIVVELNDDQGRNLMAWTTEQVRNGQGDGVDRLALRSEVG